VSRGAGAMVAAAVRLGKLSTIARRYPDDDIDLCEIVS
jgi:hypothetical protein